MHLTAKSIEFGSPWYCRLIFKLLTSLKQICNHPANYNASAAMVPDDVSFLLTCKKAASKESVGRLAFPNAAINVEKRAAANCSRNKEQRISSFDFSKC
jgi:hypothetical protein